MIRLVVLLLCCAWLAAGESIDSEAAFADGTRWLPGDRIHIISESYAGAGETTWRNLVTAALPQQRPDLRISCTAIGDQELDLARFARHAESAAQDGTPEVVIISFGHGEVARDTKAGAVSAVEAALTRWLPALDEAGAIVVLMTPPQRTHRPAADDATERLLEAYAEAIRQAAKSRHMHLIDARASLAALEADPYNAPGKLSPQGHRQLAGMIITGLGDALRRAPFSIPLRDTVFLDDLTIDLSPQRSADPTQIEIFLATDGKRADEKSRRYTKPIRITATTTLDVLAIDRSDGRTRRVRAICTREKAIPAARAPSRRETGLRWGWWSGNALQSDPPAAAPAASGSCAGFDLQAARAHAMGTKKDDYNLVFDGFIAVPAKGVYTFRLNADDQALLSIAGRDLVRAQWPRTSSGTIALDAGLHPFRVALAQGIGGVSLNVWWSGPGMRLQDVADAVLSHDPASDPFKPAAATPAKR